MGAVSSKRVLFFTARVFIGGSEKKVIRLVNCLKNEGYSSAFAFFKGNEGMERTIDKGVITFSAKQKGKLDIGAMIRYRRFVQSQGFDCVVSMGLYAAVLHKICLIGSNTRPRECLSLNMSIPTPKVKRRLPIYKALMKRTHVIFGAECQRQIWHEDYGFKPCTSEVIYNGVDSEYFSPDANLKDLRKPHGIGPQNIVLGVVATLRPEKAVQDLISASARLRTQGLPVKVMVVGDGPQLSLLEETARQEEMLEHIIFLGALEDVRPALSAMDIFILPSVAVETFSNAALEAMAMGVPVVLSDIGGAREMVNLGQNGYVYRPGNIGDLVGKIKTIIDTGAVETMGEIARKTVKERFTLKNMVDAYRKIIDGT